jgi:signal transduction histidine kinase
MTDHAPTSILLLGSGAPLAETLDAWLRAQFAAPLEITSVHTVPEVLAYLQSHRVDLVLVDEAAARNELRTIHTVSPATAIIALTIGTEASTLLCALRQGAHEVLPLRPSAETDHARTIERALARVNGRPGILKERATPACEVQPSPRLIHDLNNLLTSINGFADLLLAQLPTDNPARMGAEQIRLAGRRAATLLKTQSPGHSGLPSPASSAASSIIAKAA